MSKERRFRSHREKGFKEELRLAISSNILLGLLFVHRQLSERVQSKWLMVWVT